MSLLGVVILSFGFKIFGQRRLMKRHAPEIFGSVILSAAFSLLSTALMCRAVGLSPGMRRQDCRELPHGGSDNVGEAF